MAAANYTYMIEMFLLRSVYKDDGELESLFSNCAQSLKSSTAMPWRAVSTRYLLANVRKNNRNQCNSRFSWDFKSTNHSAATKRKPCPAKWIAMPILIYCFGKRNGRATGKKGSASSRRETPNMRCPPTIDRPKIDHSARHIEQINLQWSIYAMTLHLCGMQCITVATTTTASQMDLHTVDTEK